MDAIVAILLETLKNPSASALIVVGWGLFFVERFYIGPAREKQHKEDLKTHAEEFRDVADRTSEAVIKFTTLLEIIKDRIGRGS